MMFSKAFSLICDPSGLVSFKLVGLRGDGLLKPAVAANLLDFLVI